MYRSRAGDRFRRDFSEYLFADLNKMVVLHKKMGSVENKDLLLSKIYNLQFTHILVDALKPPLPKHAFIGKIEIWIINNFILHSQHLSNSVLVNMLTKWTC